MLSNIVSQPPLILPRYPLQRTLHIILITPPTNPTPRLTRNRRITHTPPRTLTTVLLLEPTALTPRTGGIRVAERSRVDERGVRGCGCDAEVGGELGEGVGVVEGLGGGVVRSAFGGWDGRDFC